MTYEVLLVPRAEAEVDQIVRFLSERSPQGAIAWCERWAQVLDELRRNPLIHGFAPESKQHTAAVHQVLLKPGMVGYIAHCSQSLAGAYMFYMSADRTKIWFGVAQSGVERKTFSAACH